MHPLFSAYADSLDPLYQRLVVMPPESPLSLPRDVPKAGVYLFSRGAADLYVGRSNRLRSRITNHARAAATHRQAAFAFRLARHETGYIKATYRPEGSRAALMTDPKFQSAFARAKVDISTMRVRYVEESDPLRQALLEMYVAVVLKTPHNDFDNH